MTRDQVRQSAEQRHRSNAYSRTNTPLTKDADQIGMAGEIAFATRILGYEDYVPQTAHKSRGYQFVHDGFWRIKVVTSRTPGHLFVKEGKVDAQLYVLAGINGDAAPENVWWCGFATEADVRLAVVTDPRAGKPGAYAQRAHSIPRGELRDIADLVRFIGARGQDALSLVGEPAAQHDGDERPDLPGIQARLF